MKLVPIGILSALMTMGAWAQSDSSDDGSDLPKADDTFHVSNVGQAQKAETRDKLLAVFAEFQKHYTANAQGKIVPQNLPTGTQEINGVITQVVSPKVYILASGSAGVSGNAIKVTTVDNHDWKVSNSTALFVLPVGMTSYVNGDGARTFALSFVEVPGTTPPTHEQFLAALKAGQSFNVSVVEKRDNPVSGGMDYVWAKNSEGHESGEKIPVDPVVPMQVNYTVVW